MRCSPRTKGQRVVDPGDPLCVWMTAGILSYQLCERGFDCDACPLDAALRQHFGQADRTGARVEARLRPARSADVRALDDLPGDRSYARNHLWVQPRSTTPAGHRVVRVGVEPGLAAAFLTPRSVVLPALGERVRRGRTHLWVVTEGGTFPLVAPTDGVVLAVNGELQRQPHLMMEQPLESGWVMELDVCDYELKEAQLMESDPARALWQTERVRFQDRLMAALNEGRAGVGPTLADGGVPLQHLSDVLGPARYFAILKGSFT